MAKGMASLPDDLLAEIDRTARQRGTTRSGLLAEAARRERDRHAAEKIQVVFDRMQAHAALAERYSLSGCDAHWAAAARQLRVPLISADPQLLHAGLAESATAATRRLRLMR